MSFLVDLTKLLVDFDHHMLQLPESFVEQLFPFPADNIIVCESFAECLKHLSRWNRDVVPGLCFEQLIYFVIGSNIECSPMAVLYVVSLPVTVD